MKSITNFLTVRCLLLLFLGCDKEKDLDPSETHYWGEAAAMKNGESLKFKTYGIDSEESISGRFSLFVQYFDQNETLKETLSIGFIPKKSGRYTTLDVNDMLILRSSCP
ncbi:MAG: hypothetical protein ACI83W_002587 [Marinoscillum sp.]|jgi:hypothetical protein